MKFIRIRNHLIGSLCTAMLLVTLQIIGNAQGNTGGDQALTGRLVPRAGSPEVGLTDDQKRKKGKAEYNYVQNYLAQVKGWIPENGNYRAQRYKIYKDPQDRDAAVKTAGVHRGVQIMVDKGINLPANLAFYLIQDLDQEQIRSCVDRRGNLIFVTDRESGARSAKCRKRLTIAFKRSLDWAPQATVFIRTIKPTSPQSISGTGFDGLDKTTITTIHEVGHILHERYAGEYFWTLASRQGGYRTNISAYGSERGAKEFVAEVFAAAVIGMRSLDRFGQEYKSYRGPVPWIVFPQ